MITKAKTVSRHVQLPISVDGYLKLSKYRGISQGTMASEKIKEITDYNTNQHQFNPSDNNYLATLLHNLQYNNLSHLQD